MTDQQDTRLAFNRGVISPRGLSRIDIDRMAMSAEIQTNWVPRVLGSMMLRPGLEYLTATASGSGDAVLHPFIFSQNDTAILHGGITSFRILDPDTGTSLQYGGPTNSQITNNLFDANITSWTDASETGGSATWLTGGYAGVSGDGTDYGILRQSVVVGDPGEQYHVFVGIEDGPVRFKIGSTAGEDDLFPARLLERGSHWIGFIPSAGNMWFEIANERKFTARVDQITLVGLGGGSSFISLFHSVVEADLFKIRMAQSGDVMYWATEGYAPYKVLRDDNTTWSIEKYFPEDGPFRVQNTGGISLTPSALFGDITLTASQSVFKQEHADNRSLWRIASEGQTVTSSVSSADSFTDPIRVVGSEAARQFSVITSGTFSATATLQFGFSDEGPWNDVKQFTTPNTETYDDGQDGQIIFYRLGVKAGDYSSGTVVCTLTYAGGSIQGIARVYEFTSSTVVKAHVLKDFGSIVASRDWWEGAWSDHRGWPSSVELAEGRLMFAGKSKIWGSISDQYSSFDDNQVGDSGPISRSIAHGPISIIHWLMGLSRLLIGTAENSANVAPARVDGNSPLSVISSNFDQPITPTNMNIKPIDARGVFVDTSEQRLYELANDVNTSDIKATDLSIFTPDFNVAGIRSIAVQMKPDIRVHCVRNDGTVGVLVYDRAEAVICWYEIVSDAASGEVIDVCVLPGTVEDEVYYSIKRTVNSVTSSRICKFALESECVGGQLNKQADDFTVYDGAPTTTPFTTELNYLIGETVVIWADGLDVGTDVVDGAGALTNPLATAASKVVVGLSYTAQFKSAKLAYLDGVGLFETKKVNRIGFLAENMHYQGLQYGPDFSTLYDLPLVYGSAEQTAGTIYSTYHEEDFPFGGEWDADSRICLQAAAPRPCTILAAIANMQSLDQSTTTFRRRRR